MNKDKELKLYQRDHFDQKVDKKLEELEFKLMIVED